MVWKEEVKTGLEQLANGIAFLPRPKKVRVVVKNGSRIDLG